VWPEESGDRDSFAVALDARIVLHEANINLDRLPKLAIRPYPVQYVAPWTLQDGTEILIRPIRPEDEPLASQFHQNLSEQSVYLRYFHLVKLSQRIAHERLTRLCFIDYDREMALVAEYRNPTTGKSEIVGVARLSKLQHTGEAEFAEIVSDPFQRRGLGTELLQRLLQVGRDEGLKLITADILAENAAMQRVCQKVDFRLDRTSDPSIVKAAIELSS
jgi:acetyltransferase